MKPRRRLPWFALALPLALTVPKMAVAAGTTPVAASTTPVAASASPGAASASPAAASATPEQDAFDSALKSSLPSPKAAPLDGDAGGKLGTGSMRAANRVAAEVLEQRMREQRPDELRLLREAGAADVVVVSGSYDRVQNVLRAVKVKHVVIPPQLVDKLPLMSTQTLMVNCPGNLSPAGIARVRQFVATGGYLVTTDWALNLLSRAFPGYVSRGGQSTGNDVVSVQVSDGSDPLLRHVKAMSQHPRWWLESSSYPIHVHDSRQVKVLISSQEMKRKYGHSPIVVAFRYQDGKVLHMTSHFYLQQAKLVSREEQAAGSAFAKAAGLSGGAVARLRNQGLDTVKAGELNSAYSMQQVTANVLVGKQQENRQLLEKYGKRARRQVALRPSATAAAPAAGAPDSRPAVDKDYRLRVLERQGKMAKVRDLFGREGWVEESELY